MKLTNLILLLFLLPSLAWGGGTYTYFVEVDPANCYDGDTIKAVVFDLGFDIKTTQDLRLIGINTPEIRTKDLEEKRRGYIARDWLRERIKGKTVRIEIRGKGKYGRWLAELFVDGKSLNKEMLKKKLAVPFMEEI